MDEIERIVKEYNQRAEDIEEKSAGAPLMMSIIML